MANPVPARPAARRRGPSPLARLIFLSAIFVVGYYVGLRTAQPVTLALPRWVLRALQLPPPPTAPVAVASAPATAATTGAPASTPAQPGDPAKAAANNSPTDQSGSSRMAGAGSAAPGAGQNTERAGDSGQADRPAGEPNEGADSGDSTSSSANGDETRSLATQVDEYNNLLKRIRESNREYASVHKRAADPHAAPQQMQALLDEQNTLQGEISALAQRASGLQTAIKQNAAFAGRYDEGDPVLTADEIPAALINAGIDSLRFFKPH